MDRPTVCVIVNKHGSALRPSETFLRAHISMLPAHTLPLIGNPGIRRAGDGTGPYLQSRNVLARGWRWLGRRAGLTTLAAQDTRAVTHYLQAKRVDVVLAEYGPTAITVAEACARAGVPLVVHFHGWDAYSLPRNPAILRDYQHVFAIAHTIIAVSRDMVDRLIAIGAPAEKLVHNACGAMLSETTAEPGKAPPRFVAVGRLTPKKAPFVTLLAFARIVDEFPDATLDMVGDGPLRDTCDQMIRALRLQGRATLHGVMDHDAVYRMLRTGRCFVQHSVTAPDGDSEGTPVAVLEAMAMGLAVVATRHGGIRDVIAEGETGLLVDEYDVAAMAEAMGAVAADAACAQRLGSAARAAVRNNWSTERSIERLWHIMQGALTPRAATRAGVAAAVRENALPLNAARRS